MAKSNIINTPFPVAVTSGGTGLETLTTAYGTVCAGTTATGPLQNAGVGTSGNVLTSNGAAALPTYQPSPSAPGTDFVFISTDTAATSATIEIALTGYSFYIIYISGLLPDTDAVALEADLSTDGGSTWETGASDYKYQHLYLTNTTAGAAFSSASANVVLSNTNMSNTTNEAAAGTLDIIGAAATAHTHLHYTHGYINSAGTAELMNSFGDYQANTTVDAIRFQMSSGNIETGVFKLYGIT